MNIQENKTDDELLSAYIDGELDARAEAALTDRFAAEPVLLQRLEILRQSDEAQRELYSALDDKPLPESVLALLQAGQKNSGRRAAGADVIDFPVRGPTAFLQRPVAIAASVALVAGLIAGNLFFGNGLPEGNGYSETDLYAGLISAESDVHRLLETARGNVVQAMSGAGTGRVVLSFQESAGDYCRQFEVSKSGGRMQALACRHNGSWQMATINFAAGQAPADGYVAAAAQSPELMSAVRSRIGNRQPLAIDEESALIESGWDEAGESVR